MPLLARQSPTPPPLRPPPAPRSLVSGPIDLGRRALGSPLAEALTAPHGVDRYLELVKPLWALRDMRAEIVSVRHQTPRSVTLELRPNRAWRGLEPGQFVRVSVEIDGVRHERCYSPAGVSSAGLVELTVGLHENGRVSRFLRDLARPGLVVGLSDPEGDFRLPDPRPRRLLLVSGGSGITPVLAMLRTLCAEDHRHDVAFLHYARSREEAAYRDVLERIARRHPNVTLLRSYTREPGAGELDGHLSPAHLDLAMSAWAEAEAFVCGPPALLDDARDLWDGGGAGERLHVESFVPPAFAAPEDDVAGTVGFALSGLEVEGDGRPLLEQAEDAGLRPEHGCRMGICRSCTCRKREGAVRNLITGELMTAPDEDIQICVSAPVGDVELEL